MIVFHSPVTGQRRPQHDRLKPVSRYVCARCVCFICCTRLLSHLQLHDCYFALCSFSCFFCPVCILKSRMKWFDVCSVETRNLFWHLFIPFLLFFCSFTFPVPFFPFPFSFPVLNWRLISSWEVRRVLLPPLMVENNICSCQTRSLGSKYSKNASVAEAWLQMHFWCKAVYLAANVVLFLLNGIWKLKQMWLFLDVLNVTV